MTNIFRLPPLGQKQGKPVNRTGAGKAHMARVASLPCVICHRRPVEVHHCRSNGQMRDDFRTIPLCWNHHRGPEGYHTAKASWEAAHGLDTDFLAIVADALAGELTPKRGRK